MNFISELHLGDYSRQTKHLSFTEEAALLRLKHEYYFLEAPLPADLNQVQRLICARSEEERAAVVSVLEEFFSIEEDGWHNSECDEVLAKYWEGDAERKAKADNEKARKERHRKHRADMFATLRENDIRPAFDTHTEVLRAMVAQLAIKNAKTERNQPLNTCDAPVTGCDALGTGNHYPLPSNPIQKLKAAEPPVDNLHPVDESPKSENPALAIDLAIQLRKVFVSVNAAHPDVIAWARDGVSVKTALQAVAIARQRKPDGVIPPAYLKPIIAELMCPALPSTKPNAWWTSDTAIIAKGNELNLTAQPGETMNDFKARITAAMAKAKVAA